jgi:ABC-type Fe3+/spermidine/putrescine transport system ATPase subunit
MSLSITGQRTKGSSASRPFDLDLDLAIPDSGVTALIGASGSGKTSTLRILAGLDRFQGFNVRLGEEVWQDQRVFRPPLLRPVAMVTQQPNLFPRLSARDNLRAALRATQHSSARGLSDLDGAVERFGMVLFDRDQAPAALARAIERNHNAGMVMHAAALSYVRGTLIGGNQGRADTTTARTFFEQQGVK